MNEDIFYSTILIMVGFLAVIWYISCIDSTLNEIKKLLKEKLEGE